MISIFYGLPLEVAGNGGIPSPKATGMFGSSIAMNQAGIKMS